MERCTLSLRATQTLLVYLCALCPAFAQEAPAFERTGKTLRVECVDCRPATWESEKVKEYANERPNLGGLVHAYVRNVSDKPVRVSNWSFNRREGSSWRMGMQVMWDRLSPEPLEPGRLAVLEVCGVTEEFRPGKPYSLGFRGNDWRASGGARGTFTHDLVQVSLIRVLPGMQEVEVHLRNLGTQMVEVGDPQVEGVQSAATDCVARAVPPGANTIARVKLARALTPGELLVVSMPLREGEVSRTVYSHRRAFEDFFPIGTWGADPDRYTATRQAHIDTCIRGADPSNPLLTGDGARLGLRAMIHTGLYPNTEAIRALRENPTVCCWMPHDEPDWTKPPQWVFMSTEMTREAGPQKPIMLTLCRNVKFFEYAGLADIPCMDHYCVTAPTTSVWPRRYGTRLEETAYYTRDLKTASEPKPVWVWTQGLHLWDERPKRPIPTPDELAAQLVLNLSRGAKGILWFTFSKEAGARYPEVESAVRGWGRVLELARPGLLGAEPYSADVQAPATLDVGVLAAWDRLFLAVTNLDYEIGDEAYAWQPARDATVSACCPSWFRPSAALALDPDGVKPLRLSFAEGRAEVRLGDLGACRLAVLVRDEAQAEAYQAAWDAVTAAEAREY